MRILLKRVYEAPSPNDGCRVLVDRLWPRGLSKDAAKIDVWMKEVAPSHELRKWFHADRSRWSEFRERYFAELADNADAVNELRRLLQKNKVTLLYGAKDEDRNHAAVLREFLEER